MTSEKNAQGDKDSTSQSRYQVKVYFEHLGREITLVISLYNGAEQVYVNNRLVSEGRNWRFKSAHAFQVGGVSYALEASIRRSLKGLRLGIIDVQLRADGTVIDSDQVNSSQHLLVGERGNTPLTWKRLARTLLPFFVAGGVAGFAAMYFGLKYFF